MKDKFAGVFTALVTPFKNGAVDFASIKRLVRHQLDHRIQGFVINGTTGESPTLTAAERKEVFQFIKSETAGAVPLLMGTGTFSTATSLEQSQEAERLGADGLLIVTPYYNKPPQRGLVSHFQNIATHVRLPILLYNVPGRTVAALSLESIQTLSNIQNIVGIKEASGDVDFGARIVKSCASDFLVTSGDDGTCLDLALHGSGGVISVLSHVIPEPLRTLMDRARSGDFSVRESFEKYQALNRLLFSEANPIPVKCALQLMGLIDSSELRLPLVAAEVALRDSLRAEMKQAGVL